VDPNNTVAHGRGLNSGFIDRPLLFTIHAKDADDEYLANGGDTFDVTVRGPDGDVPCNIKDNKDGTYTCSYTPTGVGDHHIDIKTKGDSIKDMPCVASVAKPGHGGSSYAKGKGFRYAYDNQEAKFKVYVRDEDNKPVVGEEISVLLTDATVSKQEEKDKVSSPPQTSKGPSRAAPKRPTDAQHTAKPDILGDVKDNNDGTYTVTYTPTTAGKYNLTVLLGDSAHPQAQVPIKETPKVVTVYWSCPNAPCRATTDSLHEEIHKLRKLLAQETAARHALEKQLGVTAAADADGGDGSNYMDEQMELKQSELRKKHSKRESSEPPQENGTSDKPTVVRASSNSNRNGTTTGSPQGGRSGKRG